MPAANKKAAFAASLAAITSFGIGIGVDTLKPWEGRRYYPYRDIVNVLTVCDGHTGKDIVLRQYSDAECDALTEADAKKHSDPVLACSPHLAMHPIILGSMTSFNYNTGAYCRSSIRTAFDKGDFLAGCKAILLYDKAGGRVAPGLKRRREGDYRVGEYELCMASLTPQRWWAYRVKAGLI